MLCHLHRLDRPSVHRIVKRAGLSVAAELDDALPFEVHRFFAATRAARIGASAKWATRAGLHGMSPGLARRLFTLHYACLCLPGE